MRFSEIKSDEILASAIKKSKKLIPAFCELHIFRKEGASGEEEVERVVKVSPPAFFGITAESCKNPSIQDETSDCLTDTILLTLTILIFFNISAFLIFYKISQKFSKIFQKLKFSFLPTQKV